MPAECAAGAIGRAGQDRELAKARRKARQEEKQRLAREERDRKAAEQAERDGQARRAADGQRRALLEQIWERGAARGGSVTGTVFAAVPDPRDPRGVRHSLACILALVTMAMLCRNQTLAAIACRIAVADQDLLAAAGARVLPDGTRAAPCARTVSRILGLVGPVGPDAVDAAACRYLAGGERARQAGGDHRGQDHKQETLAGTAEEQEPALLPKIA